MGKKLGIKPGAFVGLVRAPKDFARTLGDLPEGVSIGDGAKGKGPFDVVVLFASRTSELERALPPMKAKLDNAGGLWIGWPKKSRARGPHVPLTDLDEGKVRALGLDAGLVDNKVCAIDEVWSGLRFVYRLRDR